VLDFNINKGRFSNLMSLAFGFYAGLNMIAFIVIFFFLPETKYVFTFCPEEYKANWLTISFTRQRTLEELDYTFGVPTRRHVAYQARTWLPWFIRRYLFLQGKAQLEPLYHLEGFSGGTAVEYMGAH
jgi:hypothetical protein